jgi:raffinose/stachyose/melibiose transport system substrate-binding protein
VRKPWQLALLLAISVVGCSSSSTSSSAPSAVASAPPGASASTAAASPSGPPNLTGTTITFWSSEGFPDGIKKSWANFEAATGAKFEYIAIPNVFEDNLLAKWTGGDRPDLMGWHTVSGQFLKVQPEKNLVDLTNEAFVAKTKFHMFDYVGSVNKKVYAAITTYPSLLGVFYNKEIFSKLGLQVPTNWQDFVALCGKIRQGDPSITPIYSGTGEGWPLSVISGIYLADQEKAGLDLEINDGKATASDPRITGAWQAILDMKNQGCFEKNLATSSYDDGVKTFVDGKAAMNIQGTWMVPDLIASSTADKVNSTFGFFPVSQNGHLVSWTTGQVGVYEVPINKDPKQQEAALAFVRWITGDGYQQYLDDSGDLPVLEGFQPPKSVSSVLLEANKAFEEEGVVGFGTNLKHAGYGDIGTDLSAMLLGKKTIEQVAAATQKAWETADKATQP